MLLTVVVCTRNRARALRNALESLTRCSPPGADEWEVVVVDNASSDDTPSVIADFGDALPLRAVGEATPGLSNARNAAVHAASGAYLLWTDDDCLVDRHWLTAYADAVRRWPQAALFGGPIIPRFDGTPPEWLSRVAARIATAFAARDFGPEPLALSLEGSLVPFGANYAVRAAEQRERLYNRRLGRGSTLSIPVGEESEVLEGLLRDGAHGRWVPNAKVTHCIAKSRQNLAYLREYFAADGAYEEWRRHMRPVTDSGNETTNAQLLRQLLSAELRFHARRRVSPPERWIDDFIDANVARGRLRARRAMHAVTSA